MNKKTLRMILGIGMMVCFLNLVQFINFWIHLDFSSLYHSLFGLLYMQWMWIPNVAMILLIYLLLTRWFPYEEKDKKNNISN